MANRQQRRLRFIIALVLVLAGVAACGETRPALLGAGARVLKVKVTRDGEIDLDGQLKSLDETDAELVRLKRARGAVLYYREQSARRQPHPHARRGIHTLAELQRPA